MGSALSDSQVVGVYTESREVGWANVWKTQGGAVRSVTNIYFGVHCTVKSSLIIFQKSC